MLSLCWNSQREVSAWGLRVCSQSFNFSGSWIKSASCKTISPSRYPLQRSWSGVSFCQLFSPWKPIFLNQLWFWVRPLMWVVPECQIRTYVPASYSSGSVGVYSSTEGCTFMLFCSWTSVSVSSRLWPFSTILDTIYLFGHLMDSGPFSVHLVPVTEIGLVVQSLPSFLRPLFVSLFLTRLGPVPGFNFFAPTKNWVFSTESWFL